jgi:hypothetical protein
LEGVIGNPVLADGEDDGFNSRHQINYTTDNLQLADWRLTALNLALISTADLAFELRSRGIIGFAQRPVESDLCAVAYTGACL